MKRCSVFLPHTTSLRWECLNSILTSVVKHTLCCCQQWLPGTLKCSSSQIETLSAVADVFLSLALFHFFSPSLESTAQLCLSELNSSNSTFRGEWWQFDFNISELLRVPWDSQRMTKLCCSLSLPLYYVW